MWAQENYKIFMLMIKYGANVNVYENHNSGSTIDIAIWRIKSIKMLKVLLENGASVKRIAWRSSLPLYSASKINRLDMVKLLIKYGSNPNEWSPAFGVGPVMKNYSLHIATKKGHIKIVRYLLKKGANKYLRNYKRLHAIDIARKYNRRKILKLLLKSRRRR